MKSFTHNRLPCRKIVPTLVGLLTMFFQQNIVGQTTLGSITSGTSPGCKMTFNVCSDDTIRLRPTDLVNYTNFKWYVTSVMPANEIDGAAVAAGNFNVLSSSSLPAILIRTPGTTQTLTFIITAEHVAYPGCAAKNDTVELHVKALPIVAIVETDASCTADDGKVLSGAAATLTATAGLVSYTWDNSLGASNPQTVNPVATTTYSVTATDTNGCTQTASSTVTVVATPSVAIAETDASCTANDGKVLFGAAATLTATAGFSSYAWDNSLGTGSPKTVNPTATTAYSVTATDANGCTATASSTVTVVATPSVAIVETDASCTANDGKVLSGAAATLTATAGFSSYAWDNSLGTGSPKTVNPTATTAYSVTATDANGCTATASSTVTVVATPSVAIVETDASCTANDGKVLSGDAATLTATSGFSSYAWDNSLGAGNPKTVNPVAPTTYSVTATDANGCTTSANSTVTIVSLPDFTLAQAAVCPDSMDYAVISSLTNAVPATSQVKVNAGAYFAYPTPANITPTEGLVSGNNTITVKNTNGCETAKNINIIATPANSCIPLIIEKM